MTMKLVKVKNCADRMTAEQVQERLRAEGIESIVQSLASGMFGTFEGLDIYVQQNQAAKARKLLQEFFGESR